jgi:hypothetical protein
MEVTRQLPPTPVSAESKMEIHEIELPKPTWFDKEFTNAYISYLKYRPRYLVLTHKALYYFPHTLSETELENLDSAPVKDMKVIPLDVIDVNALVENGMKEPDVLYISFPEKVYRFHGQDISDVMKWRMAILAIIRTQSFQNPPSSASSQQKAIHFNLPSSKSSTSSVSAFSPSRILAVEIVEELQAQSDKVYEFESKIFQSIDKAKFVANLFFESLSCLSVKERNNRAKEVGIWFSSFSPSFFSCSASFFFFNRWEKH